MPLGSVLGSSPNLLLLKHSSQKIFCVFLLPKASIVGACMRVYVCIYACLYVCVYVCVCLWFMNPGLDSKSIITLKKQREQYARFYACIYKLIR